MPIRIVSPNIELAAQLSEAVTDVERAIAYGQAGLWYDAFAQGISSGDREIKTGLLRDLAAAEAENEAFSNNLLTIADEVAAQ